MMNRTLERPIETSDPAQHWEIGAGQRFGIRTLGWRKRTVTARVVGGSFVSGDSPLSSFELTAQVADVTIVVSAHVDTSVSTELWEGVGTLVVRDGSRPVLLRVRHNGVYRQRGRVVSLWLTIDADIDAPELRSVLQSRRRSHFRLNADLNLNPLS